MKIFACIIAVICMASCSSPETKNETKAKLPIEGTWRLVTGTLIEKADTIVTEYTTSRSFIKVINATHFAFMGHDLNRGKDSLGFYSSGGGKYDLTDSVYTEHLEYCNDRQWEGNDFHFTITISNDTLVQQGVEKVESAGVERVNIEKYVRQKP